MVKEISFDEWNIHKQLVHSTDIPLFFVNPREIRYVKLWMNIGSEQNGKSEYKRPVLVVKKVWILFFVIPLTTHWKIGKIFYYLLEHPIFLERNKVNQSFCILSQARVLDKRRFLHKIGEIQEKEFVLIKKRLKEAFL